MAQWGAMKRALLIVNPTAGELRPMEIAEAARSHLGAAGWEVSMAVTRRAVHATEIAATLCADCERVVVVGGDGTLRETIEGLPPGGPAVGLVPIGKANVVARDLGIPREPGAAIAALDGSVPRVIDMGTANDVPFLAMVGVGYDGVVTEGVRRLRASRLGAALYNGGAANLVYGLAGLPALLRLRPPRMSVSIDDREMPCRYASVVVSNTETYATGWSMTPGADPGDGILDHQLNRRSAAWFVLWTLGAAVLRRSLPRLVAEHGRGREYRITAERPLPWQLDGDSMPRTPEIRVRILAGRACILAPPGSGH